MTLLLALAAALLIAPLPDGDPSGGIAARGAGVELLNAELDEVLVRRFAMTADGRAAVIHLLKTRVLEALARERRMTVTDADVDQRVRELDREVRASGAVHGLAGQLVENGVDPAEFRRLLRIAIVQERLCREALGLPPDAVLTGDQQEIWIEEELGRRGLSTPPPPWPDGIAGSCGAVRVTEAEVRAQLRLALPPEQVRETCYQLLLARGIRAKRLPDLAPAALERALDQEMELRKREAEADPRYRGVPFERLLGMQGLTPAALRADPAVEVAALSRLWVSRTHSEEDLRSLYLRERSLYDSRFGEAARVRLLLLRASGRTDALNPRSFDEALDQLDRLARSIASEASFEEAARRYSEEPRSRMLGGDLGWVTRTGEGDELRSAIWTDILQTGPPAPGGRLVGPLRLTQGAILLWVGDVRPAPPWEEMRVHVQDELRRRLLEDVVPRESMVTFRD